VVPGDGSVVPNDDDFRRFLHTREGEPQPFELAVWAMQYSSRPGENVLDLFGGSGSTLMAVQQTERRAFLMELTPFYCDVMVLSW
jgi:DNA modification methylase